MAARRRTRFGRLTGEKWNTERLIEVEASLVQETLEYSDFSTLVATASRLRAGAKAERPPQLKAHWKNWLVQERCTLGSQRLVAGQPEAALAQPPYGMQEGQTAQRQDEKRRKPQARTAASEKATHQTGGLR